MAVCFFILNNEKRDKYLNQNSQIPSFDPLPLGFLMPS